MTGLRSSTIRAAAAVGCLLAAPLQVASGSEAAERTSGLAGAVSAGPAEAAAKAGNRLRNGRITYHAYVHHIPEIFTIAPGGQDQQRLTNNQMGNSTPAWSPSGRRIVFGRATAGSGFELFTMRADGTDKQRLTHDPAIAIYPVWSPVGHRIAYGCFDGSDFEICTIRRDGTNRRQLTNNDVTDNHPDWSSRGRIAFDSWDGNNHDREIYTMKPNGKNVRQVTHNAIDDSGASFSPSGRRVAFIVNDIYIKPLGGGPRFRVTHSPDRAKDMPSWSPNGRRISYVQTDKAGQVDIYTIRTTGDHRHRVTNTALREEATDWGPRPR